LMRGRLTHEADRERPRSAPPCQQVSTFRLSLAIGKSTISDKSGRPIRVSGIFAVRRKFRDHGVMRRQVTYRIGGTSVARKSEGLAAASAEVLVASCAGSARLLHPVSATKCNKCRRVPPDVGERTLADVPEFETRNVLGCMAGKPPPCRRQVERAA